jgi:hypothetical protein
MQQALANIMQNGGMGIDSGAGGALIPLRAAAPSVPLIPPEHMYEDLNPNGDDGDEDWSKFEG